MASNLTEERKGNKMAGKTLAKNTPRAEDVIESKVIELRNAGKLAELHAEEDAADDMVARIINASNDEQMFSATTPIASLVGVRITIDSANFLPSSKRPTPFAVFRWTANDGREGVTSNGGLRLVATLLNAIDRGRMPLECRVGSAEVEYEPGQFGTTYFLEPAN